jgi:DNA invertase Pin-like site-specific DNA recombinase
MKKYQGLARVSTKAQLNKGNSLFDQCESIKAYAKQLGGEVSEIIQIQVSGSKMKLNSSVLQKVFQKAKEEGFEIILSKLDRLSRDELALHQIKHVANEIGIQIHLAGLGKTIQEMSSMEYSMLAMFAQQERENLISRVRAASKKSKGSFGRIIDPKEAIQKSIEKRRRLANEWRNQIDLLAEIKNAIELLKKPTLERVAQMLNGRNLTTIRGNSWSKAHVLVQIRAMGFKNLKALA